MRAFSQLFGDIQGPSSGPLTKDGKETPVVGILSNLKENGKYIGSADAGQDWHTDMSYRDVIGFVNVLYGVKIPRRDGKPLGGTEFSNMHAAYDALPEEIKTELADATVTHAFEKFWEHMRQNKNSGRPPMTEEQRRRRPPVVHPLFLTHPITGKKVLYCNPGYAIRINELPRGGKRCDAAVSCTTISFRRGFVTPITGPRTICWCGIISAPSIAPSPITGRMRSG